MTTTNPSAGLRAPAALLLGGQALYIGVTQLHAGGDANDHHHIFAEYAENGIWAGVHLAQFAGMGAVLLGLVALCVALDGAAGTARLPARLGAAAAIAALALYGALQAVDGVALKQAVNAWALASGDEQAARFASAEAIRWLEWGMRGYQDVAMGFALLLVAAAFARRRGIALLMGLSGLAYLAQGWVAGTVGFTAAQSVAIVAGWALSLAWMSWLAVEAWVVDREVRADAGVPA